MSNFKLGKLAPSKRDSVKFGDFLTGLPTAPLVDLAPAYNYPMDLNDQYGDCVVAGFDHFRQVVSGLLTGTQLNFTEDEIIAFYKTQNPNFPEQDNGMSVQLFLEYLVTNKYILGFASVDWKNEQELQAAIYLGLGLMTGVQLQQAQMQQFETGTWDYVQGSPIDGGHCIPTVGYNGVVTAAVSWAKLVNCTQNFLLNQMDECWFVLTQAHVDHPNFRDNFDLVGFSQAVSEITGGKIVIPVNPTVTLQRRSESLVETVGALLAPGLTLYTLERPDLNNQVNVSCIPLGTYQAIWSFQADLNEWHYELENVTGRTGIFIHEGTNVSNTDGCILLGTALNIVQGQDDTLLNSKQAVAQFEQLMGHLPFTLNVTKVF